MFLQPAPLLEVSSWSPMATKEEVWQAKTPISKLDPKPDASRPVHTSGRLVPLEAHIMSKCPDALDCLRDLVLPTMQQVVNKVNFTLSFVGKPTADGGVECKHGPAECMGNILELCAHQLNPDPKIYLGFTLCITREYDRIPDRELIEGCALEHAVDFAALNECATRDDGQYAMNLLRDSVQHTAAAGVTKSCTVRLDNKIYCIRDDGEWKDCPSGPGVHDLIVNVEKLYRRN
ncbi:gamma interferon inducible lysosomal thiol reductase [Sporothrix schenckii 1099-18]|nr:gamma interferon inducible lysosomal thiol reductase [Sporothrix schenckii 1099-18]KJR80130.1 gamma interferon inducible lysosomal thiol reductase [Sporothrix schenckii 1099-18]